jgi:hypothetical protein
MPESRTGGSNLQESVQVLSYYQGCGLALDIAPARRI